jgi:hypothetical protein
MCTRFRIGQVDVTGSSNDARLEAAGHDIGLVPGGVPRGTTSRVGYRRRADIAAELADVTVGGPTDEPEMSALTLGVEAL